ncbi:hypothetical protein Desac_0803 [Desulfobacca acetoxidans DSM 11109]|uniref:Uncharacterized protein n=1 Tax=Desulfobacca acetoxidans (strain ATCC 700848 / DSM 11109 / ASRB2) TaxID=880072 RepID=F2NGR1_DESAR|nr:hypothetical protein Desac_0803 [Desulfobacca acetoxidans DSM 11109]
MQDSGNYHTDLQQGLILVSPDDAWGIDLYFRNEKKLFMMLKIEKNNEQLVDSGGHGNLNRNLQIRTGFPGRQGFGAGQLDSMFTSQTLNDILEIRRSHRGIVPGQKLLLRLGKSRLQSRNCLLGHCSIGR